MKKIMIAAIAAGMLIGVAANAAEINTAGKINTVADGKILQTTKNTCRVKHKKISNNEEEIMSECTESISFRKMEQALNVGQTVEGGEK